MPYLIWKNWRYAVDEKEIDLKRGVLIKKPYPDTA
jgi:membrane protein YdbS with pleckstrin-like domain